MSAEKDWDSIRPERFRTYSAGIGLLRITLLFGSAAIALALITTSILADRQQEDGVRFVRGLDTMATGSIGRNTYVERRSVLQPSPASVCVIRANGNRSGDC